MTVGPNLLSDANLDVSKKNLFKFVCLLHMVFLIFAIAEESNYSQYYALA